MLASPGQPYPEIRAEYLRQTQESWARVDIGPEVATEFMWDNHEHEMQRAGYIAMEHALNGHDFGIVTFDDVIVAPDVLDYFRYAESQFKEDPQVGTVTAMQLGVRPEVGPEHYYQVEKNAWYTCGCWGTWRDRWEKYLKPDYDFDYRYGGFDHQVNKVVFPREGLVQVFPSWARAQNIGEVGAHMREGMLQEHLSLPFAGDWEPSNLLVAEWYTKRGGISYMPYVSQAVREPFDKIIDQLPEQLTAGQLGYVMARVIDRYLVAKAAKDDTGCLRYAYFGEVLGVIESIKLDLWDVCQRPYENDVRARGGSVWEAETLLPGHWGNVV